MKEPFVVLALVISLLINGLAQEPQAQRPASTPAARSPQASPSPQVSPAALPTPPPMTVPTPAVQPRDDQEESDDVVRITTRLVQVDATVTDKAGKQVNDLTADDFEITENGRAQKITNFSYVSPVSENTRTAAAPPSKADKEKGKVVTPPAPSGRCNLIKSIAQLRWWLTTCECPTRGFLLLVRRCGSTSSSKCSRATW